MKTSRLQSSYEGMEIDNGGTASIEFFNMTYGNGNNKEKVKENLLKYCELDTLAEVMIVNELGKIIEESE